jgi:hypothetical protein
VAVWSFTGIRGYWLRLTKGARSRAEEERLVADLLLTAVGEAFSVPFPPLNLRPTDQLTREEINFTEAVQALLAGDVPYVAVSDHGRVRTSSVHPQVLLPGAFNPLHEGHTRLAAVAANQLGRPVAFELAIRNVDKPPLTEAEILRRLAQFAGRCPVYLTNAPRFVDKAELFPHTTFVIGADTAVRLIHPRYYAEDENGMLTALEQLAQAQAHFLVAGREDATTTRFRELADIPIPPAYVHLFSAIPASQFRLDISSTALRTNQLVS